MATVAIGLPVLNGANFVQDALVSIESQTYEDWTCVIVDNASNDETVKICEEFVRRDSRFQLVIQETTVRPGLNFKKCLEATNESDYFAWVAADDWLHPQALDQLVRLLDKNSLAGLARGPHRLVRANEIDEIQSVDLSARSGLIRLWRFLFVYGDNRDAPLYGLYRRKVLERAVYWEDCPAKGTGLSYSILSSVLMRSEFAYSPTPDALFFHRLHSQSEGSRVSDSLSSNGKYLKLLRARGHLMRQESSFIKGPVRYIANVVIEIFALREFCISLFHQFRDWNRVVGQRILRRFRSFGS